jgi:Spy/CpxP family protein refolding chaperone
VSRRAAFLALLLSAVAAAAQPQVPDGKWWKRPRVARELGLTAEQSEKIEKVFVNARPHLIDLKGDLEKRQLDLQVAMDDKSSDRADVEKKIDAVENARKQLQKARALMILDMKQVLTPEQWTRLMQMREEARDRRRQTRNEPSGQRP